MAEFEQLGSAEETQFIPGSSGYAAYGPEQVAYMPYYGLGMAGGGMGVGRATWRASRRPSPTTRFRWARWPCAADDQVHATDGGIGRVQGLVIDPHDHHVTHVLLQEGHLWGRKEVAIPISAVTGVDDGIQLSLTKDEVKDLPPVDIDHPTG